ncbi:hypothetical protein [Massilia pseudoviolaceinigra]|uniref:hypothetical protein n=1 Tax=Massilia pseudoviolaceinigra TaxID=3057165 RepID=UPI0035B55FE6
MNRFATEFRAMPISSGQFPASQHGLRAALAKARVLCMLALLPSLTSAFGPKTPIWIGQQLLEHLQASCRATIKGISVSINAAEPVTLTPCVSLDHAGIGGKCFALDQPCTTCVRTGFHSSTQ